MTSVINDVIFLLKNVTHHFNYSPQNNVIFFILLILFKLKKNKEVMINNKKIIKFKFISWQRVKFVLQ